MAKRSFGISTRLFGSQRLSRAHLLEIASHGFECVEIDATTTHVDARNPMAVADLQQWLAEARLDLDAVVAPAPDGPNPWTAGALEPVEQALFIARRIPVRVLILPVGAPKSASKAVDRIAALAEPLGVYVAIDSRSPSMTPIGSLATFVERGEAVIGVALDFATSAKGGLVDAIETVSEHLVSARAPASSGIDWAAVMTTVQKIGYDGPFIFEGVPTGSTKDTLAKARQAREHIERLLA